jgi:SHS2 domain-containing protein
MVDRKTVRPQITREVTLVSEDLDRLLYDFLTELVVIKDVDSLLFREFKVVVDVGKSSLECVMKGEPINRTRQGLRNDVKAVTMHMFGISRKGRQWSATVVLDI